MSQFDRHDGTNSFQDGDCSKSAEKTDGSGIQSENPQKKTSFEEQHNVAGVPRTFSSAYPTPPNRGNNVAMPPERYNAPVFQSSDHCEPANSSEEVQNLIPGVHPPHSQGEKEPQRQVRPVKGRIVRTTSRVPRPEEFKANRRPPESTKPQNKEPTFYYLILYSEVSKSPQFIRNNTIIQYSKDFPIEKIIPFFDEYYEHFKDENINHEELLRKKFLKPDGFMSDEEFDEFNNFLIEWITISSTTVRIQGICTKCKIQLTAKSELIALYSIFVPQDVIKTESAIEVFANSKATFISCHFYDASRVAVIARNFSTVTFINCVFESNAISCFVMDGSLAQFIGCKFKNDKNISVFVTKNSSSQMNGSLFYKVAGKAAFVKDSSKIYITNSIFDNCNKGACTIAESSKLSLDSVPKLNNDEVMSKNVNEILKDYNRTYPTFDQENYSCKIFDSKNTAIRAINKSQIKARDILIENTEGNAINIENSNGYFFNCNIKNTIHPTIAVIGQHANPIFYKCFINEEKTSSFDVICKNCCRPLFRECEFINCKTNCISISDFSRPHFQSCSFENIKLNHLNAFSGSEVTYNDLNAFRGSKDEKEKIKINISENAKCEDKPLSQVLLLDQEKEQGSQDNSDENNGTHVSSWRSPTYVLPEEISEMKDPEEISNQKELKQVDINAIAKKYGGKEVNFVCCKCGKIMDTNEDIHIVIPCGHPICNECKDKMNDFSVENKKCPICDSPIKEFKKIFIEEDCAICLCNKPNTISLPCAHFCMCYECASKCAENNFNCPMCNEPISSYKYIFNDKNMKSPEDS